MRGQHTRVIPTFYSAQGFSGEVVDGYHQDFGHIVGFTHQKAFGGASGRWSITFKKASADPLRLWREPEGVWVGLDVLLGNRRHPLTLGHVDSLRKNVARGGGGDRDVTFTLSGRDIGKPLETTELYINIYEQTGAIPMVPLYDAVQDDLEGSPDTIIASIIKAWLGNNGVADKQWVLPPGLGSGSTAFFDELRLALGTTRGRIYEPALYNPDQWQGRKLWECLQEYQNGLLNEMWVDYAPERPNTTDPSTPAENLKPTLFLRERPFPTFEGGHRAWDALTTWKLRLEDYRSLDVNVGNPTERFNYWMIEGQGLGSERYESIAYVQESVQRQRGEPGSLPIYNLESIRKHGFRRWQQSTRYLPLADEKEWLQQCAPWLQMVHDWYVISPQLASGIVQTSRLMPWIRIGDRVKITEYEGHTRIYYVEGVSHAYQYPQAGTTTLTITRGQRIDEDLLSVYYRTVVSAQVEENDRARIEENRRMSVEDATDRALASYDATVGTPLDSPEEGLDASEAGNLDRVDPEDTSAVADDTTLGDDSSLRGREVAPDAEALVETPSDDTAATSLERGDPIATEDAPTDDVRAPLEDRPGVVRISEPMVFEGRIGGGRR
jgi:hypothetical protein